MIQNLKGALEKAAPFEVWGDEELGAALKIMPGDIVLAEETVFPKVTAEVVAVVTGNIPVRIQDKIPDFVIDQMVTTGIVPDVGGHVLPSYPALVSAAKTMGETEPTPSLEECQVRFFKELDLTPLVSINREYFTLTPEDTKTLTTEKEMMLAVKIANFSLLFTIAHEAQHVWQFEGKGISSADEIKVGGAKNQEEYSAQWIERDANRAGKEFITNSSLILEIIKRIVG